MPRMASAAVSDALELVSLSSLTLRIEYQFNDPVNGAVFLNQLQRLGHFVTNDHPDYLGGSGGGGGGGGSSGSGGGEKG